MSLNFTAIDFETANRQRASVCAVGMTKVRGGMVVESVSWLIQPPTGIDSFEPENIRIHGITPADVADAADWASSLLRMADFIGEDPLVAFYAPFDKAVFHRAAEAIGAKATGDEWNCAWLLSKKYLDLVEYKLPNVAAELGIGGLNHHDAGSDALVCAQVVLAIAERAGAQTVEDLWPTLTAVPSRGGNGSGQQKFYTRGYSVKKEDLPTPSLDASSDHPFYGQSITVTGDFEKVSRMEAFELAAALGARIELNTTLKTSILVVCGEDPHAPDFDLSAGSGKQQKAHKYITERGKNIQLLSEHDFYVLAGIIGGGGTPEDEATPARPGLRDAATPVPTTDESRIPAVGSASEPELVPAPIAQPVALPAAPAPAPLPPVTSEPFINPYASAPPPSGLPAPEQGTAPVPTSAKPRNRIVRGVLMALAFTLLIIGGLGLLLFVLALATSAGPEVWVVFAFIALVFGGGGALVLRTARRR